MKEKPRPEQLPHRDIDIVILPSSYRYIHRPAIKEEGKNVLKWVVRLLTYLAAVRKRKPKTFPSGESWKTGGRSSNLPQRHWIIV